MAADVTNVKLGVCSVTYDDTDLGHTKGGVTVNYEPEYHEITVDKYGNTPVDMKLLGERFTATVPLAESTLSNFGVAIPEGTSTGGKLTIGSSVGDALSDGAAELVLHPIANAADNLDEDVVMHKAVVADPVEIAYTNDGERLLEITFVALLDEDKDDGNYLALIGDSTT